MSGPIVRTGTTPEFWANYDRVFGNKDKSSKKQGSETAEGAGSKKKSAKKKSATVKTAGKKGAKKSAKKKSGKAGKK